MFGKTLLSAVALVAVLALARAAMGAQTASLKGTIINAADRAPLGGTIVNLYPASSDRSAATAKTDRNGDFIMVGLTPGKYRLEVSRPMYQTAILADFTLNPGKAMRFPDPIGMVTSTDSLPASQISGCVSLLQPGQTADVYIVCSAPVQGH